MLYWREFGNLILLGEFVRCCMKWDFIWVKLGMTGLIFVFIIFNIIIKIRRN